MLVGYSLIVSRSTGKSLDTVADLEAKRLARLLTDVATHNEEVLHSARRQLEQADQLKAELVAALAEAGNRRRSQQAVVQQWMPRMRVDRALLVDGDGKLLFEAGPRPRPGKTEPAPLEGFDRGRLVQAAQRTIAGEAPPTETAPFALEPRRELFARVGDRLCLVLLRSEASLERLRLETAIPKLLESFDRSLTVARIEIRNAAGDLVASSQGQPARETLLARRTFALQSGTHELSVELNLDELKRVERGARNMPILIGLALFLVGGVAIALVFRLQSTYLERERELRAQAERDRRLASLGQLTAGVAHEIKNPLNAIRLSVGRLERRGEGDEKIRDAIKASVGSITNTVEDFMKLARDPSPAPEDHDPGELLREAAQHVQPMADELGRSFTAEVGEGADAPARFDRARVREALVNLLRNALQAAQGRVVARVECTDGMLRFVVDDDGPGIPPHQRREIFEYFFTTKPTGTGLGLSLAHRVAEEHGGAVDVADAPLGGARFTLSIPN